MAKSFSGKGLTESETLRGRDWPCLRQFCVFLENRVGKLNELMRHLETIDVRVLALSIVDSVDFAMVRLIFNNTDRAREKLQLSGFLFSESDVVGVALPEDEMPFSSICTTLIKGEVNIHHTYPLLFRCRGQGTVALFVDDVDQAIQLLRESGHRVITESDLLEDDDFM
ncbi:MAG: acetolactate synthase [Planctomycetaceae bacterium]